jgi:hypothetical protein
VVAVYELVNQDLRTKFKEQEEKDKGAFSKVGAALFLLPCSFLASG